MSDGNKVCIVLNGHFRLTGSDGLDRTPPSPKAQALLALLATADSKRRTRSWLQDKLWSESDRFHGAASLRQTLSLIRKHLKTDVSVLGCSRAAVWLDDQLCTIHWNTGASAGHGEFLEGIDIADPEFNDWLRAMRQKAIAALYAPQAGRGTPQNRTIRVELRVGADGDEAMLAAENNFIVIAGRNLAENADMEVGLRPHYSEDQSDFVVEAVAFRSANGHTGLRVVASRRPGNRIFWTESSLVETTNAATSTDFALLSLCFRLQTALLREATLLKPEPDCERGFLGRIIPRIFSFREEELRYADKLLDEGLDDRNAATYLGWQAQIAVINLIERFTDAPEAIRSKGDMLARKAIEADPMNSIVLATAANAQVLLDRDLTAGVELSELAIRVNAANPMAWWAHSNALLYAGRPQAALQSAKVARRLAARSPIQFWCDFQVGLCATACGDFDLAVASLETAAALAPNFRPPRRYLLALHANRGRAERAREMAAQLMALEPDFSVDRFLNDAAYPVSVARQRMLLTNPDIYRLPPSTSQS